MQDRDLKTITLALRTERAGLMVMTALRRLDAILEAEERKYSKDQPRVAAGNGRQSGRWFRDALSAAAKVGGRIAASAEGEAAGAVGGVGTIVAGGAAVTAAGVQRQVGLYNHYANGDAVTPFLHLNAPPLKLSLFDPPPPRSDAEAIAAYNECDDQLNSDLKECARLAPSGRKSRL